MRYMNAVYGQNMGDPLAGGPAAFTAAIDQLPDEQADQFLDAVDDSKRGHSRMLMRYGIGAVGGLAIGVVAAKLLLR